MTLNKIIDQYIDSPCHYDYWEVYRYNDLLEREIVKVRYSTIKDLRNLPDLNDDWRIDKMCKSEVDEQINELILLIYMEFFSSIIEFFKKIYFNIKG